MEPNTQPQVETALPQATETKPQTIKIKYNKEEMDIPYDEAVTLIQMGKNYPKVQEKLKALESDKFMQLGDKASKKYGVSRDELAAKWEADLSATEVAEYAEQAGVSPEIAKELLEAKQKNALLEQRIQTVEQQKASAELLDKHIAEFVEKYGDVEVPEEVIAAYKEDHIPLTVAYKAYLADAQSERIKALETQLGIKSVNDANASSSMGSAQSMGDTQPEEWTEEKIKGLTQKQIQAKLPSILEAMKKGLKPK